MRPFFLLLFLGFAVFDSSFLAAEDSFSDKKSANTFIQPFLANFTVSHEGTSIPMQGILANQNELLKQAKASPTRFLSNLTTFQKAVLEQTFNMGLYQICKELAANAKYDLFYYFNEELQKASDETLFINGLFEVQSEVEAESIHSATDVSADYQMIARLIERKSIGNDLNAIKAWALHLKYCVGRFTIGNEELLEGRKRIEALLAEPVAQPRVELRKYLKRFNSRELARVFLYQYKWKEAADVLRPLADSGDLLAKAWLARCLMYLNEYPEAGNLINSIVRKRDTLTVDFQSYIDASFALAQWQAGAKDHAKALTTLEIIHFETILRTKVEQVILNYESPRLVQLPLYHMYRMRALSLMALGRMSEAQNAALHLSSIAWNWSETALMATTESERLRFRELIEDVPFTIAAVTKDYWLLVDNLVFYKGLITESLARFPFSQVSTQELEEKGFDKDLAQEKGRLDLMYKFYKEVYAQKPDWNTLKASLPEKTIFVDFVRCGGRLNDRGWTEPVYYAVLSGKTSVAPLVYDLGKAAEIEADISRFLALVDLNYSDEELGKVSQILFDKLLRPSIGWIPKEYEIIFCPDAQLSFLNLAALADDDGVFVAEKWRTLTVASSRDLFTKQALSFNKKDVSVVLANPDFGAPPTQAQGGRRSFSLQPLPEASREAQSVRSSLQKRGLPTKILSGKEATEQNFRTLTKPPVIHLATHGFFLGDHGIKNPMRASGLALAGSSNSADRAKKGLCGNDPEDGILTAEEISQMNLKNTWLVSVSACESGMGRPIDGDGILGLRRGFQNAGVKNLLLCLWPIQDEDARAFMENFYQRIGQGLTPQDAYSFTVSDMLSKARDSGGLSQAIRSAGAFVLSGIPAKNRVKVQTPDIKSIVKVEK